MDGGDLLGSRSKPPYDRAQQPAFGGSASARPDSLRQNTVSEPSEDGHDGGAPSAPPSRGTSSCTVAGVVETRLEDGVSLAISTGQHIE
eukprot:4461604-Alexandrium_andersonii.AAC.1